MCEDIRAIALVAVGVVKTLRSRSDFGRRGNFGGDRHFLPNLSARKPLSSFARSVLAQCALPGRRANSAGTYAYTFTKGRKWLKSKF